MRRQSPAKVVQNWIEEELFEENGEPSGVYRRICELGSRPIRLSSLPPVGRLSCPAVGESASWA
jgi:hypothetical protein